MAFQKVNKETIFRELMAGIFPELMKDMFTHTMALIRINKYISKSIVRKCKRQEGLKAT